MPCGARIPYTAKAVIGGEGGEGCGAVLCVLCYGEEGEQVGDGAEDNAHRHQQYRQGEVRLHILVHTEEHEDAHARTGEESCNHSTRGDYACGAQPCEQHRGGTVGNESYQCRDKVAKEGGTRHNSAEHIRIDKEYNRIDAEGYRKHEERDGQGVVYRGVENTALAMAVILLTDGVDIYLGTLFAREVHTEVESEADEHADCDLVKNDVESAHRRDIARDEDGEHLVRGGEKYRDEGACAKHLCGV